MNYKVLVPSQVWEGYNAQSEPLNNVKTDYVGNLDAEIIEERYYFTALKKEDGDLRVAVRFFHKEGDATEAPTILMVSEYHRSPDAKLIMELVKRGYNVVIPDLSGVSEFKTAFPPSISYGEYENAGDHIKKVMPTARETSQYLYSIIAKRTIVFIKRVISDGALIVMGLGDAVEVAIAVVATEKEGIDGLACVNGAGYREYIKQNRYGEQHELSIDEERMCWLTGVASVAYAKYVKVPTFIAVGSNAHKSDVDRLSNLVSLMDNDDISISISPRATDFMLPEAYRTLLTWLRDVSNDRVDEIPRLPQLEISVPSAGEAPRFYVKCDNRAMIKSVTVYYASGEYRHEVRDYHEVEGLSLSSNEYFASATEYDENDALFAYAVVEYLSGFSISSLVEYCDLKGLPVKEADKHVTGKLRVVYQAGEEESGFVEDYSGSVLFEKSLRVVNIGRGMVGLTSDSDGLITYRFGPEENTERSRILQLELFSKEVTNVSVVVIGNSLEGSKNYVANVMVQDTKGMFMSQKLKITDFKDEKMMPLQSWYGIKALKICGKDIVVGNILFI